MTREGTSGYEIVSDHQDPETVERLLRALPDWFELEEPILDYINDARTKTTYLAVHRDSSEVRGALLVTRHNPESAEMHLLVVDPAHHRQGIGATLVRVYEADMRAEGVRLLHVKTLGPSYPDEYYARTTAFYLAMGYLPLEELHDYWPENNPCLILVKAA